PARIAEVGFEAGIGRQRARYPPRLPTLLAPAHGKEHRGGHGYAQGSTTPQIQPFPQQSRPPRRIAQTAIKVIGLAFHVIRRAGARIGYAMNAAETVAPYVGRLDPFAFRVPPSTSGRRERHRFPGQHAPPTVLHSLLARHPESWR